MLKSKMAADGIGSGGSSAAELQRLFRSRGWNLAGANLLAASCYVAQNVYLYVRPRLEYTDSLYVLVLTLVGALTPGFPFVGAAVGLASGGFYLLWKASHWKPAEQIIRQRMDRATQRKLVGELVEVCQANELDPEDLDKLVQQLKVENGSIVDQFHQSIVGFFRKHLRMQE